MKGSNGVLSKGRAQTYLGKMTAYRKDADTMFRGANLTTIKNPKSASQTYQRLKMLSLVPLYKVLKEAIALGWENIPAGQSLYNCFCGSAMRRTPFGISKELYNKGAGIAWDAQITRGSLEPVYVESGITDIWFDDSLTAITNSTTVGQFADAVVKGNPGLYEYDDEIAFVEVLQTIDQAGTPKVSCNRSAVVLRKDSTIKLSELVSMKGFAYQGGRLGLKGQAAIGAYCWVHSRNTKNGLKVSTQTLIVNNDAVMEAFGGAKRLRAAAVSLGAELTNEKFLMPVTEAGRQALKAFDIDASILKGALGSGAQGIISVEYDGALYFSGEDGPELSKEVGSLKITVSDGSMLAAGMNVQINGTAVSSPTKAGNVITATIPASLDGYALSSVTVTDGANNWKAEF